MEGTRRFRILVTDDSDDNLAILQVTLADPAYELVLAGSGEEALAIAARTRPDLVLLDVRMPGMDGLETCRRLKEDPVLRDVPVIFLSGLDRIEDRLRGFDVGGVDFIAKPFHPAEVTARVRTHLAIAELTSTLSDRNRDLEREIDAARAFRSELLATMMAPLQGNSVAARTLREALYRRADADTPVLLLGAATNGAEAAARAIHEASPRRWRPFVKSDPGVGLPDDLFGGTRHPMAQSLIERAALAEGGTLYIERVEALSEREILELEHIVVGGYDARIIAQLDADAATRLPVAMPATLREALIANVVVLPDPSERRNDIPSICSWIIGQHSAKLGKPVPIIARHELARLIDYDWPGGLSELEAVVRRTLLVSPDGEFNVEPGLLQDGRRLGAYRLIERLGHGGMGEVWRAKHELLPRPFAIKIISSEATQYDRGLAQRRFRREAFAISRLRSPYTVRLNDFGCSDDGELYYVMELLEGMDLHWMVRAVGRLAPARTIRFLRQAACSLVEAHAAGLVHRDIKPANLFVSRQGYEHDWLKVLDFGIVARADTVATESVMGTSGFVAPEVLTGRAVASPASDVYSLGCCAFWCLTAADPFRGDDTTALHTEHVLAPAPAPSQLVQDLPAALDDLVLACLAKDPQDRPTTAELVARLEALEAALPWTRADAEAWWSDRQAKLVDRAPSPSSKTLPVD